MGLFALFGKAAGKRARPSPLRSRARPAVEALESRIVPYTTSGDAWPGPQLITLSFVPDGTVVSAGNNGAITSDLFATLNARSSTATWQDAIIKAAQTWAAQANVNFTVVSDNGTTSGQGNYQQGDPGMGDIRFGAYNLGAGVLAGTYMPPPANNFSIAGDVNFNDQQTFNIGSTYDLQTVALHEIGHALGLFHSTTSGTVMWPSYGGQRRSLTSDDVSGIQAIYGARQPDAFAAQGPNNTVATASSLTSLINPTSLTALVNNLDVVSTSDVHYFTVTAPANTAGTLTVNVQSAGLSLLRPAVTVYAADGTTALGSATTPSGTYNGATLSVTVNGVTAGQQFYVKVTPADTTIFGTGSYALTLNFGTGPSPAVTPPNTQLLNGSVLQEGNAQALLAQLQKSMDMMYTDDAHIADADFLQELAALNASQAAAPGPDARSAPPGHATPVGRRQHLVETWFELYAGRPATDPELRRWGNLLKTQAADDVLASVIDSVFSSPPGGGGAFLERAGQALFGRAPTPKELSSFRHVLATGGRHAGVLAMLHTPAHRTWRTELRLRQLFGVPADQPLGAALEQLVHWLSPHGPG